MITTFERLAKVIKGEAAPANWIERAFASIAGALVPSYTGADDGKVLGVTKDENDKAVLAWVEGGGGGESGILIVHMNENYTLDKTWKEINDAVMAIYIEESADSEGAFRAYHPLKFVGVTSDQPASYIVNFDDIFRTDNENGYPVRGN